MQEAVKKKTLDDATRALCDRLSALSTPIIADVLLYLGFPHQVLNSAIRPLDADMEVTGPAFCIRGEASMGVPSAALHGVHQPHYELFNQLYEGSVLVYATGGYGEAGIWGDQIHISVRNTGCRGVIIDGATRDAKELIKLGPPTFVSKITPMPSPPRFAMRDLDIPVVMPGQTSQHVVVNPGDIIRGDYDGVIVIPAAVAEACVTHAEELTRTEEIQRQKLLGGASRVEVYRSHNRFGHIKPLR